MRQATTSAKLIGIGAANGILVAAALTTSRPVHYLALAVLAGTFINLTFLVASRLWEVQP